MTSMPTMVRILRMTLISGGMMSATDMIMPSVDGRTDIQAATPWSRLPKPKKMPAKTWMSRMMVKSTNIQNRWCNISFLLAACVAIQDLTSVRNASVRRIEATTELGRCDAR